MWTVLAKYLLADDRKISAASFVTVIAFWFFAGWTLGMVPAFGSGFAKADDVRAIQSSLLEASILDLRIRYCSVPSGTDVKRYFFAQTQKKVRLYKVSTGADFMLPPCKDLVYVAAADDTTE